MSNSLVASAVDQTSAFSGAYLITDSQSLADAIQSGSWIEGGMAQFSMTLNTAAAIVDPIGTLIANGLGWLLDHVEPLKGWLNDLTGSASEVEAFAQTWNNVSLRMGELSSTAQNRLGDLDALSGATFDAYRAHVTGLAQHLASSANWAGAVSVGLSMASEMVQLAHDLVRDAISQIVGMAVSAAVTAVITLGAGVPAVAVQVGTRVAALTPRIARTVETVVNAMNKLRTMIQQLTHSAEAALRSLTGWKGAVAPTPTITPRKLTVTERYTYRRPSGFRKGVRDEAWDSARASDGLVRDPLTGQVLDRTQPWDMGHKPGYEHWKHQISAADRGISRSEFLDEFNNPDHYRPELPASNRSHQGEDATDAFHGP